MSVEKRIVLDLSLDETIERDLRSWLAQKTQKPTHKPSWKIKWTPYGKQCAWFLNVKTKYPFSWCYDPFRAEWDKYCPQGHGSILSISKNILKNKKIYLHLHYLSTQLSAQKLSTHKTQNFKEIQKKHHHMENRMSPDSLSKRPLGWNKHTPGESKQEYIPS